jgi:hypothetical protein
MKAQVNEALLRSLVSEVDQFRPAFPAGATKRRVDNIGFFEELGLRFDADDYLVGLHYAGLAVLARDMHRYLAEHPRDDAALFEQVVSLVHAEERTLYQGGAFPTYEGLPTDDLPEGLASAAAAGQCVIARLGDVAIVHEWTFKAGKRLFVKFSSKFKDTICGKDGPYEQFTHGLVGQAALPTTIASSVLTAGFSAETFWYPLAVYLSILLVKTGLKTYCET